MKEVIKTVFIVITAWVMSVTTAQAQNMSLERVIQNVIDHYPSFKTAAMQVERAKQENAKVQSQLGWQLGVQAGAARDVSLFGTTTDTVDLGSSLSRKLEEGETVSLQASVTHEDAETAFSPTIANPVTKTGIDLNYRLPLLKGNNNPAYKQGLVSAGAGVILAQAEQAKLYDQLATQIMELYFSVATTQARLHNVELAIKRTQRLYQYNKDRASLGVSEDKDLLQVMAQLRSQQAEYNGLQMNWEQQRTALNRLMGYPWDAEIITSLDSLLNLPEKDYQILYHEVKAYNPSLKSIEGRLQQAESVIVSSRDANKDQLDLILFAGGRNSQGDAISGNVDNSDVVGGMRVEYNQLLDKRGTHAVVYQARLDKGIALQDKQQIEEDLQYDLASLLAELKSGEVALKSYKISIKSEQKKLKEANQRYRRGRSDTEQLILFESQLSTAELLRDLQRIELARRYQNLNLLRGSLWDKIKLTDYSVTEFIKPVEAR